MNSNTSIDVEIWSDFLCPYCYIGKKNFEKALSLLEDSSHIKVIYRSFELNPAAEKSQNISIYEYLAEKYGKTLEWAKEANQNVTNMGIQSGITMKMDLVKPTNSFDAHRLAHLALKQGKQSQLSEILFETNFSMGKDIASHQVLIDAGVKAGLNESDITSMLSSSQFENEVRQDEATAQEFGITGVPFFVFNRKLAVSGAQQPQSFLQVFKQIEE